MVRPGFDASSCVRRATEFQPLRAERGAALKGIEDERRVPHSQDGVAGHGSPADGTACDFHDASLKAGHRDGVAAQTHDIPWTRSGDVHADGRTQPRTTTQLRQLDSKAQRPLSITDEQMEEDSRETELSSGDAGTHGKCTQ